VGCGIIARFGGDGICGYIEIQSAGYGFVWLSVKAEIDADGAS
jgi:hypothetical protein